MISLVGIFFRNFPALSFCVSVAGRKPMEPKGNQWVFIGPDHKGLGGRDQCWMLGEFDPNLIKGQWW